ncbi:MAG: bifunctional glycosyltransferase family 2/GtrA family protein [bacterium]|nr:bifunctional glycosyltransferase family 2/GtrA family protein [bacterium]
MISIIIPAYNEEDRIGNSLEKLAAFLEKRNGDFEVILVDDASTDRTSEIAQSFANKIPNFKVLKLEKSPFAGKGYAVNKGILASQGEIAVFTDSDFSTPIEEVDKLLKKISDEGFDIAIGSRALDRSTVLQHQGFLRELMGRSFNILVRIFTVRGIVDTQCGFKAFKMSSCREIFEQEKIFDFGFDVELLFEAQKTNLKIAEVPVLWFNDKRSTVNPIIDSTKMFLDLIKIRMYHGRLDGSLADKIYYLIYHHRTFWRFSIVGVSNTIVDYGLFFVLTKKLSLDALVANPINVEVAILWSFFWNNLWTFSERKSRQPLWSRFLIFQLIQLGGLALSQNSLLILHKYFGLGDLLAKALTIPVVLVFNYVLNSRWAFSEEKRNLLSWFAYSTLIVFLFFIYFYLNQGKFVL